MRMIKKGKMKKLDLTEYKHIHTHTQRLLNTPQPCPGWDSNQQPFDRSQA